ncbi:MAG: hypothetical protein LQ337_006987, partial [Flavoplaca oasis]
KFSRPLLSKCFPIDLPGFSPVAGSNPTSATIATDIATTTLPVPPFVNATTTAIEMVTDVPEATLITATAAESSIAATAAESAFTGSNATNATNATNIAPPTLPVPPFVNATTTATMGMVTGVPEATLVTASASAVGSANGTTAAVLGRRGRFLRY